MPPMLAWIWMNRAFNSCLNYFVVIFIDDILIYFKNDKEHGPTSQSNIKYS